METERSRSEILILPVPGLAVTEVMVVSLLVLGILTGTGEFLRSVEIRERGEASTSENRESRIEKLFRLISLFSRPTAM